MIDLSEVSTSHLKLELTLRRGPQWRCVSCGYYASGSGNWPCPSCGKWHYWTGSGRSSGEVFPQHAEKYTAWESRTRARFAQNDPPVTPTENGPEEGS